MMTYTLIANNYIIARENNQSVTFNKDAADLWESYEKWLEEGNTPLTAKDDPFLSEQSTPILPA
jgi:hypothetical protein